MIKEGPYFYLTGGVHTDMSFATVVEGTEETHGPYDTYKQAVEAWRGKMGWNVDNCYHRLFVTQWYVCPEGSLLEEYDV